MSDCKDFSNEKKKSTNMSTISCSPKFDYVNNKTHINKWKTTTNSVQSKCLFFMGRDSHLRQIREILRSVSCQVVSRCDGCRASIALRTTLTLSKQTNMDGFRYSCIVGLSVLSKRCSQLLKDCFFRLQILAKN